MLLRLKDRKIQPHMPIWKREDLRDPRKGAWGLPVSSCHTLRTAALHEWCSLELYTSHPGDNKWQLPPPFPSPHPLFKSSSSGFVCFIYWSYWKIFVWKEGCVSKSIWNPPTHILGYWRSKDLGGDGDPWDAFPGLPLPKESLSGFEEGHLGSWLSSSGMVACHLGKWQPQLRKMASYGLKDLILLQSGAHLPRDWYRLEEERIQCLSDHCGWRDRP